MQQCLKAVAPLISSRPVTAGPWVQINRFGLPGFPNNFSPGLHLARGDPPLLARAGLQTLLMAVLQL